jgi:hypothetical protein
MVVGFLVLGHWSACHAQISPGWSFWGTADGMKESYTSSVAVHAGSVWIKHGSISGMNLLDGFGLVELPNFKGVGKMLFPTMERMRSSMGAMTLALVMS